MKSLLLASVVIATVTNAQTQTDPAQVESLQLVQTIPLPGVKGKFDHLAVDLAGGRMFVAAKMNNTLEVIDLQNGRRLRSVTGFHEPQGVLYLRDAKQVVVANGGNGEVQFLDGTTLQVLQHFSFGADADNIRYDADTRRIFVACQDGAIGTIDLKSMSKLPEIKLPGHPEAMAIEPHGHRLFVNVPKVDTVFVLDRSTAAVTAEWKLTKSKTNYTMALDEGHHRLFVGCRQPSNVVGLDTTTGHEIATFPIGGETDCMFYDGAHQRIYVTGAAGPLDVVQQLDADHYRALQELSTAPLARTCLSVPELDRIFVAVPQQKDHDAELRVYRPRY
jgi:DNA-binding beta-propeller fold protein YncE